jgi:hypothetical protein
LDTRVTGGAGLIIGLVPFVPGFIAGAAKGITLGVESLEWTAPVFLGQLSTGSAAKTSSR